MNDRDMAHMRWLNEPKRWGQDGDTLIVTTNPKTDFWRRTHYGFVRDNGHAYLQGVEGDFTAEVSFIGDYAAQYDQAGLMVRLDEYTWLKTGVEWVDAQPLLSAVVTRDFSDWSVLPASGELSEGVQLRIKREGTAFTVHYALRRGSFDLLRLAYLPAEARVQVGPMCASPEGDGFETRFSGFRLRPNP
jgi:uncharacterized protein